MRQDILIENARVRCDERIREEIVKNPNFKLEKCPMVWDGILCWPTSNVGVHYQPCSDYVTGFDRAANATKECTPNGWWVSPEMNRSWTNYTACTFGRYATSDMSSYPEANPTYLEWIPIIKTVSQMGYKVSLVGLVLACIILLSNRKLLCPRNIIHLHLFASFLMRATMTLLKDKLFIEGVGFNNSFTYFHDAPYVDNTQEWQCKVFVTLREYFILANYSWILVEGVYLHNLIFMALFSDTSSIRLYVILGWSVPAFFAILWGALRSQLEDTLCWTTHSTWLYQILHVPIVVSVVINLILFINITRVLLIKLNSSSSIVLGRRVSRYRKWAKSTLVLMPLYGVHYALFLGLSYSQDPVVTIVWLFCDQLFASSQGLCVSILFCLINGEVIQVMKTNWKSLEKRLCGRVESFDMWRKGCSGEEQNGINDTSVGRYF